MRIGSIIIFHRSYYVMLYFWWGCREIWNWSLLGAKALMGQLTCGAVIRFISSRRVCSGASLGRLFFRASNKNEVQACTWLVSMNTSTIWNHQTKLTILSSCGGWYQVLTMRFGSWLFVRTALLHGLCLPAPHNKATSPNTNCSKPSHLLPLQEKNCHLPTRSKNPGVLNTCPGYFTKCRALCINRPSNALNNAAFFRLLFTNGINSPSVVGKGVLII